MEEKEVTTKRRAAARGWVRRQSNALKALLDQPTINEFELRNAIETFDRRLSTLDERQAELELLVDEEDLNQCIDEADSFRRASQENWLRANEKLQKLMESSHIESASFGSASTTDKSTEVKLSKLELPKFKGDVTEWQSFWDLFTSHIDDTELPVTSKFSYLLSLLEGEAKSAVQGLSHTSANYSTACDLLKERYGRPEIIIFAHVQSLLSLHVPVRDKNPKYVTQLWSLRDEIVTHIKSLEALGVSGKQCEIFLTPIIVSRLPNDIRLEWARKGAGHESDLDWLLTFLRQETERIPLHSSSEALPPRLRTIGGQGESRRSDPIPPATSPAPPWEVSRMQRGALRAERFVQTARHSPRTSPAPLRESQNSPGGSKSLAVKERRTPRPDSPSRPPSPAAQRGAVVRAEIRAERPSPRQHHPRATWRGPGRRETGKPRLSRDPSYPSRRPRPTGTGLPPGKAEPPQPTTGAALPREAEPPQPTTGAALPREAEPQQTTPGAALPREAEAPPPTIGAALPREAEAPPPSEAAAPPPGVQVVRRRKYRQRKTSPEFASEMEERPKMLVNSSIRNLAAMWVSFS